jgi:hypothetical protein
MHWVSRWGWGLLVGLATGSAQAGETEREKTPSPAAMTLPSSRWSIGAGVGFAGNAYTYSEAGLGRGTDRIAVAEVTLAPAYQLTPSVALGLPAGLGYGFGGLGIRDTFDRELDEIQTLGELALSARYQAELARGWYGAVQGGVVGIRDRVEQKSTAQSAPLAALAVGHDFRVAPAFALGLELRIAHAWFPERGRTLLVEQMSSDPLQLTYAYGSRTWFGLTFTGRVLL